MTHLVESRGRAVNELAVDRCHPAPVVSERREQILEYMAVENISGVLTMAKAGFQFHKGATPRNRRRLYLDTCLEGAIQVSRDDAIIVERAHARTTFP